ncbi:universal stress protein [Embleya sp. NPDC008237]|uniref:universal stress protein n=1 Tax=Embleya sp. NPDC008237 TaxID=3363978 RepID=UPI0036E7DECC
MSTSEGRAPIVVGVEGTASAHAAVAWAADEAHRRRLPLRLVCALDWPADADRDPAKRKPTQTWSRLFEAPGRHALAESHALAVDLHPALPIEEALVDGAPADVLRAEARTASMVVLGSRELSSMRELMTTGGIAVPVVAHAPCPVVVVRDTERVSAAAQPIVVGVDGSAVSERALAFAFEEAALRDAEVLAVHVRSPHPGSVDTSMADADEIKEGRRRLKEALAGYGEKYPGVTARREVALGHPVHVLVRESEHALCLVVGTRGVGGFRGMLLGSVAYGVLHHAHCPVAVLPRSEP